MKNSSILPPGCKLRNSETALPSVLSGQGNVKALLELEGLLISVDHTRNYVQPGQKLDPVLQHHLRIGPGKY